MAGRSVIWAPITARRFDVALTLRAATPADAPMFERWDKEPHVIAATTDTANAVEAYPGMSWQAEIGMKSDVYCYYVAEIEGRPLGAMLVIDPALEPSHYWGDCEPNLRALDIWIGCASDRSRGYGEMMMRAMIGACFSSSVVTAIIVDPLASNTRAHAFYQRLGFTPLTRRIFNNQDDCLVHRLQRADWREGH